MTWLDELQEVEPPVLRCRADYVRAVRELMRAGLTVRDIAVRLNMTDGTVRELLRERVL